MTTDTVPVAIPHDDPREAALADLFAEIRACRVCADALPLGPRPIIRGRASARLLIVSQAPGTRVHETGLSFNDRSGDRLRDWLGVDRATFYDERRVAVMGMGFCYPGVDRQGGDLPPRPECAPLWHERVLALLPDIRLTLLVGGYGQRRYLAGRTGRTMTDTVARWRDHLPRYFPTPHPSWRNTGWLRRNPWFEAEALPELRRHVADALG
ncbi:MAG TPA: uracil-DNA glycosylase family protein [Stellaceae bacterium]|nr:uracil-DNA glycosylase family protein [Stellaceae bacterium]